MSRVSSAAQKQDVTQKQLVKQLICESNRPDDKTNCELLNDLLLQARKEGLEEETCLAMAKAQKKLDQIDLNHQMKDALDGGDGTTVDRLNNLLDAANKGGGGGRHTTVDVALVKKVEEKAAEKQKKTNNIEDKFCRRISDMRKKGELGDNDTFAVERLNKELDFALQAGLDPNSDIAQVTKANIEANPIKNLENALTQPDQVTTERLNELLAAAIKAGLGEDTDLAERARMIMEMRDPKDNLEKALACPDGCSVDRLQGLMDAYAGAGAPDSPELFRRAQTVVDKKLKNHEDPSMAPLERLKSKVGTAPVGGGGRESARGATSGRTSRLPTLFKESPRFVSVAPNFEAQQKKKKQTEEKMEQALFSAVREANMGGANAV